MKSTIFSVAALVAVAAVCFSASGMRAGMLREGTTVYADARQGVRCVIFSNTGVAGSYEIDYGAPEWKSDYESKFDAKTLGKRFRFGKDHWTRLDSTCPLVVGGKEVKAGLYYLCLERSKKGEFSLVLLDPEEIRKSRTDPFQTEQTKGGLAIPLELGKAAERAAMLHIDVKVDAKNDKLQTLAIEFGPHRLTAAIQAKV